MNLPDVYRKSDAYFVRTEGVGFGVEEGTGAPHMVLFFRTFVQGGAPALVLELSVTPDELRRLRGQCDEALDTYQSWLGRN